MTINEKTNQEIDCFIAGSAVEANREVNANTTWKIHQEYSDVFTVIWCFIDTLSLLVKYDAKLYIVPPRWVAYALQKPFKKIRLQEKITGTTKAGWNGWMVQQLHCRTQPSGTVQLCLDHARLNQALIRPIHRGPALNNILFNKCALYDS